MKRYIVCVCVIKSWVTLLFCQQLCLEDFVDFIVVRVCGVFVCVWVCFASCALFFDLQRILIHDS